MAKNIEASQLGVAEIEPWKGLDLFDYADKKLGKLKDVYLDDETTRPKWGQISVGFISTKELFVPLANAVRMDDGIHIKAKKVQVDEAPEVPADGRLTAEQEHQLTLHYGLDEPSTEEAGEQQKQELTMPIPEPETSDGAQPEATRTLPPGLEVKLERPES